MCRSFEASGPSAVCCVCFFFSDTATTEIYTLSLHDALPIYASLAYFRTFSKRPLPAGYAQPEHSLEYYQALKFPFAPGRSEEHTSELQSQSNLVCRLLLEKKKKTIHHSP